MMVNAGDTIPYELALVARPDEIEVTDAVVSRASDLIGRYADHMA